MNSCVVQFNITVRVFSGVLNFDANILTAGTSTCTQCETGAYDNSTGAFALVPGVASQLNSDYFQGSISQILAAFQPAAHCV